jgi:2-methylisocitrate lyase-like PEP mutase family enzyme
MERYCHEVPGPKLANMLEYGKTPILPPKDLQAMGYTIAAYPLSLLGASIKAMQMTLQKLSLGEPVEDMLVDFKETQRVVGFPEYYEQEDRYKI